MIFFPIFLNLPKKGRLRSFHGSFNGIVPSKDILPYVIDHLVYLNNKELEHSNSTGGKDNAPIKKSYPTHLSKPELEDIINSLGTSSFQFKRMLRTWIPKPRKLGNFRPITQPHLIEMRPYRPLSLYLCSSLL